MAVLSALAIATTGIVVPLTASPALAGGSICYGQGFGGRWPQFPTGSVYVTSVGTPAACSTQAVDPVSGFRGLTYKNPSELIEGDLICWRWNQIVGGDAPPPAPNVYLSLTTSPLCKSSSFTTTIDPDNARLVTCPTCPHGRVFNDASNGRSHLDNSFHEGFALNSMTVLRGTRLATTTASVPPSAGCTETLADRRIRVEPLDGSAGRWACMVSVSGDQIRFYLNAAPGQIPVHKEQLALVALYDGAQANLNLQGRHGVRVPLRAIGPALYSADGSGSGMPSASVKRVRPDGSVVIEPFGNGQTISLNNDQVFLVLRATGIRYQNRNEGLSVQIGSRSFALTGSTPHSFGPSPTEGGVDEVQIRLDTEFNFVNQPMFLRSTSGADTTDYGRESNDLNLTIGLARERVFHRIRRADGTWTNWGEPDNGNLTRATSVSAAADSAGQTHVVAAIAGRFFHRVRNADGSWSEWGEPSNVTGLSPVTSVSAAIDSAGRLHVVAAMGGRFFHRVRNADGSWTEWGEPTNVTGLSPVTSVSAAIDSAGRLHVVTAMGGRFFHRVRNADGSWTEWGEPTNVTGLSPVTSVSAAVDSTGRLQVVAAMGGRFFHRVRNADGSWTEWGEPTNVTGLSPVTSVSAAVDSTGRLHIGAVIAGRFFHRIRFADGTWSIWGEPGGATGNPNSVAAAVDSRGDLQVVTAY